MQLKPLTVIAERLLAGRQRWFVKVLNDMRLTVTFAGRKVLAFKQLRLNQ